MFSKGLVYASSFLALVASVSAHFQLQYPSPRGDFVEDNEVNFCDGYTNAVDNRTTFPLGQAFINLNSEHPSWSAQVLISIEQNPTNFSVFNTSTTGVTLPAAVPFFKTSGEGLACIAIDIESLGIEGVKDGSNVTIQVQFDGGDGNLFQCADLTLSSNATVPSSQTCSNLVDNSTTSTSSSTSASATSTGSGGNKIVSVPGLNSVLVGLLLVTGFSML
ncbi:hypothetical protein PNOK_0226200 [Pyrrhoderma noxium]|uniref:Copper acquisition factor BIM1-like domain-containing protein n=1 Tax=Pyrrhoderma noxium TaxID=2282107 RepID=A0A286US58_9AGAM|nr:hypothetical protein PNOK_0226200 [Pyrrhoderma noxium]